MPKKKAQQTPAVPEQSAATPPVVSSPGPSPSEDPALAGVVSGQNAGGPRRHFSFGRLSTGDQKRVLDRFAEMLMEVMAERDAKLRDRVDYVLRKTGEVIGHDDIDSRHFPELIHEMCRHDPPYLKVIRPHQTNMEHSLTTKFKKYHPRFGEVKVAEGQEEQAFFRIAAEEFLLKLVSIGHNKVGGAPLNVGIVSGTTTGGVIRAAVAIHPVRDLGVDRALPPINIFAVNVCLGVRDDLRNNATILAYQLAQCLRQWPGQQATPYGLSAELFVKRSDRGRVDGMPQTRDVVRFTQPERVVAEARKNSSELDIILTGIGSRPDENGVNKSYFQELISEFAVRPRFDREMVGDLIYTAIDVDGRPLPLLKQEKDGTELEYEFYSAVELNVLKEMAQNPNKAVILVVRNGSQTGKIYAIRAAIRGSYGPYASTLIVDEETASALDAVV